MSTPSIAPARLRQIAIDACAAAAETIRASTVHAPIATKSTVTDIVTATDLAAEAVVRDRIGRDAAGSRILSEESGHEIAGEGPHHDIEWVVDPLDGTANFAYRIPISSVSVAAVVDGRPAAGAVIDVARNEIFSAHSGGGAHRDDDPLSVSGCDDPALALVATGFSYDPARRMVHGRTIADLLGRVRDIRVFGSAALQLCWVAMGRLDAYVERDIKPWDHCAGGLIAAEAGALVELPCAENDAMVLAANAVLSRAIRPLVI